MWLTVLYHRCLTRARRTWIPTSSQMPGQAAPSGAQSCRPWRTQRFPEHRLLQHINGQFLRVVPVVLYRIAHVPSSPNLSAMAWRRSGRKVPSVSMYSAFPSPPPWSIVIWQVTHSVWQICVLPVRNSPNISVILPVSIPPGRQRTVSNQRTRCACAQQYRQASRRGRKSPWSKRPYHFESLGTLSPAGGKHSANDRWSHYLPSESPSGQLSQLPLSTLWPSCR
jgi:hypothetical protein